MLVHYRLHKQEEDVMKEQARLWWRQATQMAEEAKIQEGRFAE